jgi:hypothetical protein
MNASEEFLGQRDDDSRGASLAEPVLVLVLDHLADEFGAVDTQAHDAQGTLKSLRSRSVVASRHVTAR